MGRPPKNSLSFFKVFNKATSSDKMKIPPAYALHMLGTIPQMVSLRDEYGNHWPVKLANIKNQLYLEEGWAKFVEDNSIETGDFIFFQYHDDKVFHVKLTGRNSCDKKGVGAPKSNGKDEESMEVEIVGKEMEEQENQPLEEQVDEEKEEGNKEDLEEQGNQLLKKQVKRKSAKKRKQVSAKIKKQVKSLARKVGKPKSKGTDGVLRKSSRGKNFQERAGAKCGRANAPDYYGADIFKSGILPLPKNPYFVTKIRPKRREELYIPVDVLKDCSIKNLPAKATLRDSCGRTWSTNLTSWSDGRKFYVGGWSSFCRLNFVAENDQCICEFVKERGPKDLVIQLQVVPTRNNTMVCGRDQ